MARLPSGGSPTHPQFLKCFRGGPSFPFHFLLSFRFWSTLPPLALGAPGNLGPSSDPTPPWPPVDLFCSGISTWWSHQVAGVPGIQRTCFQSQLCCYLLRTPSSPCCPSPPPQTRHQANCLSLCLPLICKTKEALTLWSIALWHFSWFSVWMQKSLLVTDTLRLTRWKLSFTSSLPSTLTPALTPTSSPPHLLQSHLKNILCPRESETCHRPRDHVCEQRTLPASILTCLHAGLGA